MQMHRIAVIILLLVLPFKAVFSAGKPEAVTIGYLNLVNAQLIAKGLGLHEKAMGVPVKWVKFDSGGAVNTAVAGGGVDFGGVGNPPASIGVTRGLPYEGIFVLNMLGDVESMAVRADKNIKSVKDLAGKTLAAPFGSTTHYLTLMALKEAGVDPSRVKMLDMSPSDALAAWLRGDIDAAYVWEPNLNKMVRNGGTLLVGSGGMAKKGYPTWDVAVVMKSFATKYPDYVVKFVKSECAAIDYWLAKPKEAAAIIARELSLPIEDAERMMRGTKMVPCQQQITGEYLGTSQKKGKVVDTLVATAVFLKEQNRLPVVKERAAYEAFVNPSYVEKAVR